MSRPLGQPNLLQQSRDALGIKAISGTGQYLKVFLRGHKVVERSVLHDGPNASQHLVLAPHGAASAAGLDFSPSEDFGQQEERDDCDDVPVGRDVAENIAHIHPDIVE